MFCFFFCVQFWMQWNTFWYSVQIGSFVDLFCCFEWVDAIQRKLNSLCVHMCCVWEWMTIKLKCHQLLIRFYMCFLAFWLLFGSRFSIFFFFCLFWLFRHRENMGKINAPWTIRHTIKTSHFSNMFTHHESQLNERKPIRIYFTFCVCVASLKNFCNGCNRENIFGINMCGAN